MATQYIELGDKGWHIIIYYDVSIYNFPEIADTLYEYGCPEECVTDTFTVLKRRNTGFTYTNFDYKVSVVCIGKATEASLFLNTLIHEAKHVQSHICYYYGVDEDSEEAAYLIGYIASRMYKTLAKILRLHV